MQMPLTVAAASGVVLAGALICAPCAEAQRYLAVPLGSLGGDNTLAVGINSAGDVVGWSAKVGNQFPRAFVFRGGVMQELAFPAGEMSFALAINERGEITGSVTSNGRGPRAYRYASGSVEYLFPADALDSVGTGINANGEISGTLDNSWAFVHRDGAPTLLFRGQASGINDSGEIAGTTLALGEVFWQRTLPVRYSATGAVLLAPGWTGFGDSKAINDRGDTVGTLYEPSRAFVHANGQLTMLPTFGISEEASGINNSGHVVGSFVTPGDASWTLARQRAFLWTGAGLTDLSGSLVNGPLTLNFATAINDRGQIVALACYDDAAWATFCKAYRLDPIPQPATVVEFYNATLDHYFITHLADEIAQLDAKSTRGWARTGQAFVVHLYGEPRTSPVCRLYLPPALGDSHFFGRDASECAATTAAHPAAIAEASAFFYVVLPASGMCEAGTRPVYRLFSNRADANHRYVVDRALRDAMIALGWIAEGDGPERIAMCAAG